MDVFDTSMRYLIYFPSLFWTQESTWCGFFFLQHAAAVSSQGFWCYTIKSLSLSIMADCGLYLKGNFGSIPLLDIFNENIGLVLHCWQVSFFSTTLE